MRPDSQGIGLAIVQKVINELGGCIEIGESELGGAEFKFELPVMEKGNDPDDSTSGDKCTVKQH